MNLSKNLTLAEAIRSARAERLGINNAIPKEHPEHLENLKAVAQHVFQPLRDAMGAPITVSSGYRSPELNRRTPGASSTSQHCRGEALDLVLPGRNAELFHHIRTRLQFDQLIWEHGTATEPAWVHVSLKRSGPNRMQILRAAKVGSRTVYKPWTP